MNDPFRQLILTAADRKADDRQKAERQERDRQIHGLRLTSAERRWCCIESRTVTGMNLLTRSTWWDLLDHLDHVESYAHRYGTSPSRRKSYCKRIRAKIQAAMSSKPEVL